MPAVSNTSPILNLAIIGYLFLMREQFGQLFIPPAVLHELRIEEDLPGSRAVYEAIDAGWIQVADPEDVALVQVLQRELDKGEAEAIALAFAAQWRKVRFVAVLFMLLLALTAPSARAAASGP